MNHSQARSGLTISSSHYLLTFKKTDSALFFVDQSLVVLLDRAYKYRSEYIIHQASGQFASTFISFISSWFCIAESMGGAKSKYDDTDWVQANGKLKTAEETIDGRPPTTQYGVYYVTKTKMNQRVRCCNTTKCRLMMRQSVGPDIFSVYS